MVSDRAVFVHNGILRSLPRLKQECQRLEMSIVVSSITAKPPVAVVSNPQAFQHHKGKDGQPKIRNQDRVACQRWIESLGSTQLPNQIASIVGSSQR